MPFDIITIGSATRDVFLTSRAMHPHRAPDALTHIEACFPFGAKINIDGIHFDTGGGATNNAATFARLGKFKVAALCRIGTDSAGHDVVQALRHDRVDTSLVQTARDEQTAYSTIISPGGEVGERTILVYRGASHRFNHGHIPWQKMKARWFYISSLDGDIALLKKILAHAKKIGAQVAFNPGGQELNVIASAAKQSLSKRHPRLDRGSMDSRLRGNDNLSTFLSQITFLILNREESSRLTGVKFEDTKGLLRVLTKFAPSTIMTDGPKGAYAATRSVILNEAQRSEGSRSLRHGIPRRSAPRNDKIVAYYVPSVGHKPRNLTGAGDAFGSGFFTGWIRSGGDIKYALRLASFNADSVVQKIGAKVGILKKYPSQKELANLPIKMLKL